MDFSVLKSNIVPRLKKVYSLADLVNVTSFLLSNASCLSLFTFLLTLIPPSLLGALGDTSMHSQIA